MIAETAITNKNGKESKSGEYPENLARVSYIRYLIIFQKKSVPELALFDLYNKINAIYSTFAKEVRLSITLTDIRVQKIDGIMLDIYRMVVEAFLVTNKANWVRFFEENILVANICLKVILGMFFPTLSSVDVDFLGW